MGDLSLYPKSICTNDPVSHQTHKYGLASSFCLLKLNFAFFFLQNNILLTGWHAEKLLNGMLGSICVPSHSMIVLIVSSFLVETR